MPDQLVQISKREGRIARVKRGETPVIELYLAPGQYVTSVELERIDPYGRRAMERKTVDWRWSAFVVTPLGVPVDG